MAFRIATAAVRPRSRLRQAITTVAPFSANAVAVSNPRPLFAPVTTTVLSEQSGIRSAVHESVITLR
jgi:hypothetical protein